MKSEKVQLSVIVPVYNVEQYLKQCIDSILNQTFKNFELILVDDGALDSCPQICDNYSKHDDRVKVIHKKNGGLSSARNAGIKVAKGKFLTFIDSDDWISKNYFEEMMKEQDKYNADIISIRETTVNSNGEVHHHKLNEKIKIKIFKLNCIDALFNFCDTNFAWGKLIRTKIILDNKILFPVGKNYEDVGTMYKVYDKANVLVISDRASYFYRIRANSITNNIKKSDIYDQIYFLNQIKSYVFKVSPKYLDCYILCRGFIALSFLYKSNLDDKEKNKLTNLIYKNTQGYKFKFRWIKVKENFLKIMLMHFRLADKVLNLKSKKV